MIKCSVLANKYDITKLASREALGPWKKHNLEFHENT